jgi:hypothetical protein
MKKNKRNNQHRCYCILVIFFLLALSGLGAQDVGQSISSTPIGMRYSDAQFLRSLLLNTKFIMRVEENGRRVTVPVRQIRIVYQKDDSALGRQQSLYDRNFHILLNGQVLNLAKYAILYDERIVNLGALFTYAQEFDQSLYAGAWEYGE